MRKVTMLWCRQGAGKTEIMRGIGLVLALWLPVFASIPGYCDLVPGLKKWQTRGVYGIIVGPNEDRAKIAFKRIKADVDSQKLDNQLARTGNKIIASNSLEVRLSNGSYIVNLTGSDTTCKEGETADWIFFDESQDISSYSINSTYMPALSTTQGTAIFAGTSNNQDNDFYHKIQANLRNFPANHSCIPEWIARTENLAYGQFVDKEILDLPGGKESPIYKMKYACEWELSGVGRIISWDKFQRCQGTHRRGQIDRSQTHRYFIGADFGRVNDRTVITLLEHWLDHYRLIDWLSFEPSKYSHTEQDIITAQWLIDKNVEIVGIGDSTGLGDVRIENLNDKLDRNVIIEGLVYSAQSKDMLYKAYERMLPYADQPAKIYWPACDPQDQDFMQFSHEMLDCELENKGNFYRFGHPDNKKETVSGLVPHDDYVCSLFNAIYAAERYSDQNVGIYF